MRYLYKLISKELPIELKRNNIINDLMKNWEIDYNLFSITQLASRNNENRRKIRRYINQLIDLGIVEKYEKI